MKRYFSLFVLLLIVFAARSQKTFFVYIQAESNQPFFVKMGEKNYNSSGSGYIILSNLVDSAYSIGIGFTGGQIPEQRFTLKPGNKDQGYLLKNFGDKGWGLFNLQTMEVQMSSSLQVNGNDIKEQAKVSAFTDILAKAANDPTLLEKKIEPVQKALPAQSGEMKTDTLVKSLTLNDDKKPLPQVQPDTVVKNTENKPLAVTNIPVKETLVSETKNTEEKKSIEDKGSIQQDTVSKINKVAIEEQPERTYISAKDTLNSTASKDSVLDESFLKRTIVTRKSESSTTEGFSLVFLDDYGKGKIDTVRILIQDSPGIKLATDQAKVQPREEKKFLDFADDSISQSPKTLSDTLAQKQIFKSDSIIEQPVKDTNKVEYQNNCIATASDIDFLKLRKDMAAEMNDDAMIDVAKREFKNRCYTVAQIKNLSTLFLSDEGKYKFFDASYSFVSDVGSFSVLQSELKDDYFINRFKAMLRN
ncbi:MAG: DUF4476 domain-containing protein [Bacteroidetes bacterium]|nr:DUF4476 domain-containing protein [Bacteroidota bacterium]